MRTAVVVLAATVVGAARVWTSPGRAVLAGGAVVFATSAAWGDRPEAIVHGRGVPVPLQPRRQNQNTDGRHPVGQHRKVRLAGHKIESCGMDEGDAHAMGAGERSTDGREAKGAARRFQARR